MSIITIASTYTLNSLHVASALHMTLFYLMFINYFNSYNYSMKQKRLKSNYLPQTTDILHVRMQKSHLSLQTMLIYPLQIQCLP